jgi:hypothetical protein
MDSKIINKFLLILIFFTFSEVAAIEFKGKFIQGHFIIGKTKPDSKITIDKKIVKISKDGYFAFGIEKDRKFDIVITEDSKKIIKSIQKKGTPIKAMNNGIVTLAEEDLFYTGATLIFDHGHGISTLYMHMDKIFVNKGDHIKKGDIVGTVGTSGRSTGPHLDIRLNWFGTRLDPATILDIQ